MSSGSHYLGSKALETSQANKEIIPESPSNWSYEYKVRELSLMNSEQCTIVVNNKYELYLRAGQGFAMNRHNEPITSIKIKESGIEYNWIGAL